MRSLIVGISGVGQYDGLAILPPTRVTAIDDRHLSRMGRLHLWRTPRWLRRAMLVTVANMAAMMMPMPIISATVIDDAAAGIIAAAIIAWPFIIIWTAVINAA